MCRYTEFDTIVNYTSATDLGERPVPGWGKYLVADHRQCHCKVERGRNGERESQVIQEAMDKNKAFLNLINDIISSSSLMCIVFYLLRVPRYD